MAPEQTNAKRHGPNRATTVICLVLILAAALVIARMVKFRSQVDVTLPAALLSPILGQGLLLAQQNHQSL